MTRAEILRAIGEVAHTHLAFTGELTADMRLVEDLHLDSLRLLTLAVEVENRFRIRLEPDEEAGVATAGDLVELVHGKLGGAAG